MIQVAQRYDHVDRVVRDINGTPLVCITTKEIREVFRLSEPTSDLEKIDFDEQR